MILSDHKTLTAADVVREDAEYMLRHLSDEFERMKGDKLLITGGAGFLGYYLTHAVAAWNKTAKKDDQIALTVSDNFMRGTPDWLDEMKDAQGVSLIKWDVRDEMPAALREARLDWVIHAASIASPTFYRARPIETIDANIGGLRQLLDLANTQTPKPKGILFYSSSEIYGDPQVIPTPEDYRGNVSCTGPRACYDEAKRFGETLCVVFAKSCGLPVKVARPFNNYGPGLKLDDRRVVSDFARDILAGNDITMLSDGTATRTFCYVADAVIGYFKVLVKGEPGEAFNIGIEEPEVSVADFARAMATAAVELFDYKGGVVTAPPPDADYLKDNPNRRCPVMTKAREQLGFEPKIDLNQGLRKLLAWYADHPATDEEQVPSKAA
jgi:nucleoside-diphosphate-sugar epimerase